MVRSRVGALLVVLLAVLVLPATALGAPLLNSTFTINLVLSPPYTPDPARGERPIVQIQYELRRDGQTQLRQIQRVNNNGPTFTYAWTVPSSYLATPGRYAIVAYPMIDDTYAIYQGTANLSGTGTATLPITASRLATPTELPRGSAGTLLVVGALALLAVAGAMLALRQTRLGRLQGARGPAA